MPRPQLHIGETNRPLKGRDSDHRNQVTSATRFYTKYTKAEFKDFTIIDRDSNTLHCQGKWTLQICTKDPLLNRNIGKVRIPSAFNKLLNPCTQLGNPHSFIPPPKGALFHLVFQNKRQLTPHLHNLHLAIEVSCPCSLLSNFKTILIFRSPPSN